MFRIFATVSITLLVLLCYSDALPVQELPPKKGHVPVYIRVGDMPLSEVHPGLAEAFHEDGIESVKSEDKKEEAPEKQETKEETISPEQSNISDGEEVVAKVVETVEIKPSDEPVVVEKAEGENE